MTDQQLDAIRSVSAVVASYETQSAKHPCEIGRSLMRFLTMPDRHQDKIERFIECLQSMSSFEWRIVLHARIPAEVDRNDARRIVATAIGTKRRRGESLSDREREGHRRLSMLLRDQSMTSTMSALGGPDVQHRVQLAASDAVSALLVLGLSSVESAAGLTPAAAAVLLYAPFEEIIPLTGL